MSMTFFPEMTTPVGFAFACVHGHSSHRLSFPEAEALLLAEIEEHGHPGALSECIDDYCSDALVSIHPVQADPGPDSRLGSGSAARLLRALGLPTDQLGGTESGSVMLARINRARAAGLPVDARDPGYYERRCQELYDVAVFAEARGRKVCWA